MSEPEPPASTTAPASGAPYVHPAWATGPNPVDSPHVCAVCGARIRKNHESYRGHIPMEMTAALRKERPAFHPRQDICKPCGEKWYGKVAGTMVKQPWMKGRLG